MICSWGYSYETERIEFTEMDEKKKTVMNFLLEKTADRKARLTIDFYVPKNMTSKLIFSLTQKKQIENNLQISLMNLETFLKDWSDPIPASI